MKSPIFDLFRRVSRKDREELPPAKPEWLPETILPMEELVMQVFVFREYIKYLVELGDKIHLEELNLNKQTYLILRQELRLRLRLLRQLSHRSFEDSIQIPLEFGGLGRETEYGNGEGRGESISGQGDTEQPKLDGSRVDEEESSNSRV